MSDDLRHRYADALDNLDYTHDQQERRCVFVEDALEAVAAVRDEELERLQSKVGWHGQCVSATKWAEELRDKLNAVGQRDLATRRAETAEATIARILHLRDVYALNARTAGTVQARNWFELFAEELQAALDDPQQGEGLDVR